MPLPARMKPVRASRVKIKELAEKADRILGMIDSSIKSLCCRRARS